MERKIGEIFEYNGEWYQCLKSNDMCNGCAGKFQPYSFCHGFEECVGKIFKRLEKVGEPYEHYGKLYQCYKLPMEIEIRLLPNNCNPIGKDNLVEIEIKQNKEDMEEKKLNLKPFDIQKAREGKPVCTRDGRKARIVCFDAKGRPIVALVDNGDDLDEEPILCHMDGYYNCSEIPSNNDLMMLSERREGWVNINKGGSGKITISSPYSTKEEAIHNDNECTIDTIKIEWSE